MKSVWIASLLVFLLSDDVVSQITFDCPSPQTGLANNPFLIYCVVTSDSGEVPNTYWLFNSVIVPNQGERTTGTPNGLIIQNLQLTDGGDWVCTGELASGYTDTITVQVIVDDFPGPPLNLAVEATTSSSVLVTFDRPEGSELLTLTQWVIEYRASDDDSWTSVIETDTAVTQFPIAGLVTLETYTFRAAAETAAGRGNYTQELSITIPEDTTPSPTTTNLPQQPSAPVLQPTTTASVGDNTETSPTSGQQSGNPPAAFNSILTIVLGLLAALIVLVLVGVGVYVWCKRSRRRVVCQTADAANKTPPA